MTQYYDALETRSPAQREHDLMAALPAQIAHAQQHAPFFTKLFDGVNAAAIHSRAALAELPVTRKGDLVSKQMVEPPFGGMNATPMRQLKRVFQSPGPIHEPQGFHEVDTFRIARAMYAAGIRKGDLIHNTFSYHFTPGAWIMEGGAHALGCCVFPAGIGQTEQQAQTIAHLRPQAYSGTPSFLKIILEKAKELGLDCGSLQHALVSGEALPPSLRQWFAEEGINVQQAYATADVGLIAYESSAREGLIVDEGIILEIVEPGGTRPLPEGEVGEVVVTVFDKDYPLVRFGTGDLSAILPGQSPCGRTAPRIRGWLGRADQTTKVKGMFVHPGQVGEVARRHPEIRKARLVVTGTVGADVMTLHCEGDAEHLGNVGLIEAVQTTLRDVTKLRGQVRFGAQGSLPNDGKMIEDARSYE